MNSETHPHVVEHPKNHLRLFLDDNVCAIDFEILIFKIFFEYHAYEAELLISPPLTYCTKTSTDTNESNVVRISFAS
jgi:hypothetical protein